MADDELWTIGKALTWCEGYLERRGIEDPRLSAQWLLSNATGLDRIILYTDLKRPLSTQERDVLRDQVRRRGLHEPLQYLSGKAAFRYLTVDTAPGILIPRPETEILVEVCLRLLSEAAVSRPHILEIGTGTGCIACSLASEHPAATVVSCDIDPSACVLAKHNVSELGLTEQVSVLESDLDSALAATEEPFDLLVSNPPYIPTAVYLSLDDEVRRFESRTALDGGEDGLDIFRRLLNVAEQRLRGGGVFAFELHEDHLDTAAELASNAGFLEVAITPDLAGRPRILSGVNPDSIR